MNSKEIVLRGTTDSKGSVKIFSPGKEIRFITTAASNRIAAKLNEVCCNDCPLKGTECAGVGGVYTKGIITEKGKNAPVETKNLSSECQILNKEESVEGEGIIFQ